MLSLDHFLLRQRVRVLWREILRACKNLPPSSQREMKIFAREEFIRNKQVSDTKHIRYLLSTGKEQLQQFQRQFENMGK